MRFLRQLSIVTLIAAPIFSGQAQDICSKKGPQDFNDVIQRKVYDDVLIAKEKIKADTTLKRLENGYEEVKTGFNTLYKKMADDLGLFTKRKTVCEKYSAELIELINKANAYDATVLATLKMQTPAAVGVDDILQIIEWVWTLGKGLRDFKAEKFYNAISWEDWSKVKAAK